ncbi:hypothetical protein OS493_034461 [Desmophyllum pertusum]|uniref:medium-chain acyl-CoA ligase n=1 Tax=Desmophyllum pertusum TaxID=174260 RepID=A0A9W9Z760_9CNID|nr:hypothetical protein OS493_034461 [Desmophyllum pertusum]
MDDGVIWGTKDFQVPEYFNFADVIDEWAQKEKEGKRQSDHPALWWIDGAGSEVKWSYQDVVVNSKKTANILSTTADVKPGERCGVDNAHNSRVLANADCMFENRYYVVTGGVIAALPVDIGPKELHWRILRTKPVCVVAASCDQIKSELFDVVDQIASSGQVDIRSRIVVERMKHEQRDGWLSFENLFQTASADYQSVKSLSSAPTGIYFTSGTTGNSKMAEHSQASYGMGSTGIRKYV